jgi:hypothetical protein
MITTPLAHLLFAGQICTHLVALLLLACNVYCPAVLAQEFSCYGDDLAALVRSGGVTDDHQTTMLEMIHEELRGKKPPAQTLLPYLLVRPGGCWAGCSTCWCGNMQKWWQLAAMKPDGWHSAGASSSG